MRQEIKLSTIRDWCKQTGNSARDLNFDDWTFYTDEEAHEALVGYIQDSCCYFRKDFLASCTELPEEVFHQLALADDAESVWKLIGKTCGHEYFVEQAELADGRGHFLSSYDGEELELCGGLFAYRQN